MTSKLFKRMIILVGLLLVLVSSYSLIYASNQKSVDNGVTLYVDYGNGYEYLTKLYYGKSVTEQSVMVNEPITALRVVRGECYDFNLDRVTLNGVCPVDYERKLSATDNDLLEVEDKIDFELEGKGELVISARTPETVQGEDYSIKFPKYNIGAFKSSSYFYKYELNSNNEIFSDLDELQVPSQDSFFISEMCYPDSGHPDAPIDFYVANDDDNLYVFFEAFVDNTLDHGKDFAGVHIKCGDEIKSYKVYTTEKNEYGRWWFEYTESSDEYDWQHMNYLVRIPLADIGNDESLDIAFEYYGTVSAQELLERLGVGGVYYITQEMLDNDIAHAHDYEWSSRYYDDECIRILPGPGKTSNANSGDTEEGDWWLTNTGTEEKPEYTLYLNGVTLHESRKYWREAVIAPYGSITICLVEGTTNTLVASKEQNVYYAIDAQASMDINIKGNGTLNLVAPGNAVIGYGNLTITDGAVVNAVADNSTYDEAVYFMKDITLDNGTLRAGHSRAESEYVVNSFGLVCRGKVTLLNNSLLEVSSAKGEKNYGLAIETIDKLSYDEEVAVIKEGDSYESGEEVDELTRVSDYPYYSLRFGSKPYVLIDQREVEKYTVTTDFNGATVDESYETTRTVLAGTEITLNYIPSGDDDLSIIPPDGKEFDAFEVSGERYSSGDKYTVNSDITIKYLWKDVATSGDEEDEPTPTATPKPKSSSRGSSAPSSYKITTKVENGFISPMNPKVKRKASQEFLFSADEGYEITDVLIDGESIGVVKEYTLEKVTAKHTIEVKTIKILPIEKVDDWAKDEMREADEKGLIPETFMKKDATISITRAEFAAITVKLYEAITGKEVLIPTMNPFTDTFDEYVLKAYALGITLGTSENTFSPNLEISREQMATMITRCLIKAGIDCNIDLESISKFADDSKMHEWSRPSIYFMAKEEIIKGVGNNNFDVTGNTKIQEAIAVALRSYKAFMK